MSNDNHNPKGWATSPPYPVIETAGSTTSTVVAPPRLAIAEVAEDREDYNEPSGETGDQEPRPERGD